MAQGKSFSWVSKFPSLQRGNKKQEWPTIRLPSRSRQLIYINCWPEVGCAQMAPLIASLLGWCIPRLPVLGVGAFPGWREADGHIVPQGPGLSVDWAAASGRREERGERMAHQLGVGAPPCRVDGLDKQTCPQTSMGNHSFSKTDRSILQTGQTQEASSPLIPLITI